MIFNMGSDLFSLKALALELDKELKGAKVDKIQQPECDELRFFLRSRSKNACLVASCNAQAPRVHLTATKKASPKVAPGMLMLLRKYLSVAVISEIGIYNADRILYVKFSARNEMGDEAEYYLFAEIMNRYSNLVFTDSNLIILDAIKHLPLDIARDHVVMRGVKYAPVKQQKISYLLGGEKELAAFEGGDLFRYILNNISGFCGNTVTELLLRAGVPQTLDGALSDEQLSRLIAALKSFREMREFAPCIQFGEVYPMQYRSLGEATSYAFMSEAYDALYTDIDIQIRNRARLKALSSQVKKLLARIDKNIAQDVERLNECESMDKFRIYGELIVGNIYLIKRGDETLECENYFDGTRAKIKLDPTLSPSKNAAAYFAKYNKLKRTKEFTVGKLSSDRELKNYVMSIESELESLPYEASVTPIEEELEALGVGKRKAGTKVRKEQKEPPYIYEVDGFEILRGKNNLQNDELTFKTACSSDIWLHVKNEHGPHVVILCEGRSVPEKVIKIAAEIAACFMGAASDVDYTRRVNVKRKPGGHPAQVVYVNFKTLRVNPDPHKEFLIKS